VIIIITLRIIFKMIITLVDTMSTFKDFVQIKPHEMTLLSAPVLKGKAQDMATRNKISDLETALGHLTHLDVHDASVVLKNSLAIPRLLYLLRTTECPDNPLLREFDSTLWFGLITVLNVDLDEDHWLQASLPVADEVFEYGVLRCWHLQPFWYQLHPQSLSNRPSYRKVFGN